MSAVALTVLTPTARLFDPEKAVHLAAELNGSQGENRAKGSNQLGADDDVTAVRLFLEEYKNSPATQRSYRKECERLLLWALLERGKALSSLNREDFAAYGEFLADPQPASRWCGPRRGRAGARLTEGWRPFVGPMSPSARRTALVIINSMMTYLVQANYLAANPLALIRQRHRFGSPMQQSRRQILQRCFDDTQWEALLTVLEDNHTPDLERGRFLVALLYFLALRIGEVATHTMGHFQCVRGKWLFLVLGKGAKEAEIPVNAGMLDALKRYRLHLGMEELPTPEEPIPLVGDAHGGGKALSPRRLNQLLKGLLDRAAEHLTEPLSAAHMRQASAHWFRHTSLTRQANKGLELRYIKDNARHAKLDTTMLYVHTDSDTRHAEMEKLTWR